MRYPAMIYSVELLYKDIKPNDMDMFLRLGQYSNKQSAEDFIKLHLPKISKRYSGMVIVRSVYRMPYYGLKVPYEIISTRELVEYYERSE